MVVERKIEIVVFDSNDIIKRFSASTLEDAIFLTEAIKSNHHIMVNDEVIHHSADYVEYHSQEFSYHNGKLYTCYCYSKVNEEVVSYFINY